MSKIKNKVIDEQNKIMKTEEKKYLLVINDCVECEFDNLEKAIEYAEHCYYKNKHSKIEVDNVTDDWVEWLNGERQE